MEKNGNEFKGLAGGVNYKRGAALFGFTEKFYRKGVGKIVFSKPIKALDLGCGPGALCYALAEKVPQNSAIWGVDISTDQLNYARKYANDYPCKLEFITLSMDELDFPADNFDLVMTSMALHETPIPVRQKAIKETARVLKKGGEFILVDWSKPKFGLWGIIWFPILFLQNRESRSYNWNNTYKALCEAEGLKLIEDTYISSIARRQVYRKE